MSLAQVRERLEAIACARPPLLPSIGFAIPQSWVPAMAFLRAWCQSREDLDKEVLLEEFGDRVEWISALFDDDKEFEAMMKAAWRLK